MALIVSILKVTLRNNIVKLSNVCAIYFVNVGHLNKIIFIILQQRKNCISNSDKILLIFKKTNDENNTKLSEVYGNSHSLSSL